MRPDEPYNVAGLQDELELEGKWPPLNRQGQPITGYSHAYAIKVREMFFP